MNLLNKSVDKNYKVYLLYEQTLFSTCLLVSLCLDTPLKCLQASFILYSGGVLKCTKEAAFQYFVQESLPLHSSRFNSAVYLASPGIER